MIRNSASKLERNNLNFEIIRDAGHAINHEQAYLITRKSLNFGVNDIQQVETSSDLVTQLFALKGTANFIDKGD